MPEVGFEPTHPKIIELKSTALDHSAIQAYELRTDSYASYDVSTAEGFEPPRADTHQISNLAP